MECANHPGAEPGARCILCARLICADCMVDSGGRVYCPACAPARPAAGHAVTSPDRWLAGLDLPRAFSFLLDDPEWLRKFLVGCLMVLGSFLIVPLLIVLGYELQVLRSAASGQDRRLPAWDGVGGKLKDGAGLALAEIAYSLPLLLILGGTIALGIAVGGGARGALRGLAVALFMIGWLLTFAAGAAVRLVMPAVAGRLAVTGSVREALRVGRVLGAVRANARQYLAVLLVYVLLFSLLAPLGFIACFVGASATWFYSMLVTAHLYGQLTGLEGVGRDE